MHFAATDKITIIGKSGCGKTTLSRKLHESGLWKRVVVFDRLGEYDARKYTFVARGFNEFADIVSRAAALPSFRILYRFDLESDRKDAEFNEALRILYYLGGLCIVIEETWNFASKNYLPKWYREILLTGRHGQNKISECGIALITTSQRPAEVHKTVFSQSHHIFCGQAFETNDLKYIADFIGRENAEKLPSLKRGDFLQYSILADGGVHVGVVKNR